MISTAVRLSKASRRALTPKRGNKDFYKGWNITRIKEVTFANFDTIGTRQAYLPGGHRTGAPGKHIIGGSGNYRIIDEKVRVFIAPSIDEIKASPVSWPPTSL